MHDTIKALAHVKEPENSSPRALKDRIPGQTRGSTGSDSATVSQPDAQGSVTQGHSPAMSLQTARTEHLRFLHLLG